MAKDGKLLIRQPVDATVSGAERLVFEGGPVLGPGLAQDMEARRPRAYPGAALDSRVAIPDLTEDEKVRYDALVAAAKEAIRPAAEKVSAAYHDGEVEKLVKRGVSREQARATVESRSGGTLTGADVIDLSDGTTATVAEILADPKRYHRKSCADPVEGRAYGTGTAIVYSDQAVPVVSSFAHGGAVYRLVDDSEPVVDISALMDKLREATDPLDEALGAPGGAQSTGPIPVPPYWPRPKLDGPTASARLKKIARAFWNAVELRLRAADRRVEIITERTASITAEDREQLRPRVMRKCPDLDDDDKIEAAIDALIKRRISAFASRQVRREFGIARMAMPRIQIAGAAGLGKSWAVIREYLARPYLWTKHINVYVPTIDLAYGFKRDFQELLNEKVKSGAIANSLVPTPWVVAGRSAKNCARYSVVSKGQMMVPSAYKSFCFDGCFSYCQHDASCKKAGFMEPYQFRGPCLRVLAHEHIAINQSADIRLPEADVSIVDENCLRAAVKHTNIQLFMLTDPITFQKSNVDHVTVSECLAIGEKVETVIKAGGDVIDALRKAGVSSKDLHFAARIASGKMDQPVLKPHWPDQTHFDEFRKFKENQGRKVAGIFSQLGRDMDRGRVNSLGVEYDPHYPISGASEPTFIPMFITHRLEPLTLPAGGALLVIDADASKRIGRRVFGDKLRHMNLPALREGHKTQNTGDGHSHVQNLPAAKVCASTGAVPEVARLHRRNGGAKGRRDHD
ncbi:MAG: hypothetical protein WCJ64_19220 [Rhodospirillaceae bacterium]